MKTVAFISPAGLAFSPAALNGPLLGRGMPPSCPAFAAAFPGTGSVPCNPAMIEVSEAAEVYELRDGKYLALSASDNESRLNSVGQVVAASWLDRKVNELKSSYKTNLADLQEAVKAARK